MRPEPVKRADEFTGYVVFTQSNTMIASIYKTLVLAQEIIPKDGINRKISYNHGLLRVLSFNLYIEFPFPYEWHVVSVRYPHTWKRGIL